MGKMKFHIYGQQGLVDLPDSTTVEDLRSLASFNRIIKNYTKMERIENENKRKVYRVENEDEQKVFADADDYDVEVPVGAMIAWKESLARNL